MKCDKCLFAKDIDKDLCKCSNSMSDWYGSILFLKWDGCKDVKSSTVGMNKNELFRLQVELRKSEVSDGN